MRNDQEKSEEEQRVIIWMGDSLKSLRRFPEEVKDTLGQDLFEVQSGRTPKSAKPLKAVGSGVYELRDDFDTDTYRCVYIAKLEKGIYVLHAFKKKSKSGIATPREEIEKVRERYRQAVRLDKE
jgi:phage-related protein